MARTGLSTPSPNLSASRNALSKRSQSRRATRDGVSNLLLDLERFTHHPFHASGPPAAARAALPPLTPTPP